MSTAYKCDRCARLYEKPLRAEIGHRTIADRYGNFFDICPECNTELNAWWIAVKKDGAKDTNVPTSCGGGDAE